MLTFYKDNQYNVIAGGTQRTWCGTKEAYEIDKDKIPPNTMICITDDNMGADDILTFYTEAEKKVGIWIDGKYVYRRIFNTTAFPLSVTDLQIDKIISLKGIVENTAGAIHEIPYEDTTVGTYIKTLYYDKNGETIQVHSQGDNIASCTIIIEYTKKV